MTTLPLMNANSDNPLEASIARLRAETASTEPCADCGFPVFWNETLGDWAHVNPERACWLHDSEH